MHVAFLPAFLVDRIGWLLVHSMWQFTLIALAVAVVLRAMQRTPASVRYWTCLLGWAVMVIAPAVTCILLPAPTREAEAVAPRLHVAVSSPHPDVALTFPAADPLTISVEPVAPTVPAESAMPWWVSLEARIAPWLEELVAVWCLGVLSFGLRPGWGWYIVHRLRQSGISAVPATVTTALKRASKRLGIRREVRVRQSKQVKVPMVVGYLRPLILLPLGVVSGLSAAQVEAVLAHELAHIRRHDYLVNLLQTLMETVCFYHPAVWWLSSRIRHEREHCCDELAVQTVGSRADYGRALLALEELRGAAPVLSLGANGGSLHERIRRLAAAETSPQTIGSGGLLIVALSIVLLSGIGIWTATRADEVTRLASATQAASEASEGSKPNSRQPVDAVTTKSVDERAAVTPEDTPAEGVVQGILVDAADGTPVPGARIILRSGRTYHAESDADGKFRLENIPPNPRQYLIWAYARNRITPKVQIEQTISEESDTARFVPLRLEMREGKRAKFVVTSALTGKPLAGAMIRFGYPDRRKTLTAADGTAVVQGLLAQEYDVTIEADGHARQAPQIDLSQSEAITEYKAALHPGGIVRGVAVDEQGQPLRSASVVYRIENGTGFYGDAYRTDADGRFQNRFLPFNTPIEISVHRDGYISQKKEVGLSATNRELDIQVALPQSPRESSIAGVVEDSQGNPVQGAQVASYGNRSQDRRETITDADGKFTLGDLFKGYTGYNLHIAAKGFAPQRISVEPGTPESPGHVSVNLEAGHTIRGQIVDANTGPLSGVLVTPRSTVYGIGGMGKSVRTRENGRFAFDSLPADVRFGVSHPEYPSLQYAPPQLDGDDLITVTLEAPGVLQGRVIDAETMKPVHQFRVRLGFSRSRKPSDPRGSFDSSWSNPGITFNSNEGDFLIKPLKDGLPLELTVLAEGYERSIVARAVAARADRSEALTVSLKRVDLTQRFTLTAQILDHAGQPAAGAHLRLIVSTDPPTGGNDNKFNWVLIKNGQLGQKSYCEQFLSGITGPEGRFEFKNVLPGKYLQLAYWGDGVPQGRSLDFDETQPGASDSVTIKLPQPAQIRGTIERSRFAKAGSIQLSLDRGPWHIYEIKLGEDQATFAFDDLPPGDYSVVVFAKPVAFSENGQQMFRLSPLAQLKIQLQAGETKKVSFTEPNVENR